MMVAFNNHNNNRSHVAMLPSWRLGLPLRSFVESFLALDSRWLALATKFHSTTIKK
jgi:hypothetical protein